METGRGEEKGKKEKKGGKKKEKKRGEQEHQQINNEKSQQWFEVVCEGRRFGDRTNENEETGCGWCLLPGQQKKNAIFLFAAGHHLGSDSTFLPHGTDHSNLRGSNRLVNSTARPSFNLPWPQMCLSLSKTWSYNSITSQLHIFKHLLVIFFWHL